MKGRGARAREKGKVKGRGQEKVRERTRTRTTREGQERALQGSPPKGAIASHVGAWRG